MDYWNIHDSILEPITYEDLVLVVKNINPRSNRSPKDEFIKLLKENCEEALELFETHFDKIYAAAFPDEREELTNHPNWPEERVEALAKDIYQWLIDHQMWIDTCIYFNGKRWSTTDGKQFRYNGEPFEEEADPRDHFEYVADPHILSLSFEGTLYEVLNACCPGWYKLEAEFMQIFNRHGCRFELGNAWNLTCYE